MSRRSLLLVFIDTHLECWIYYTTIFIIRCADVLNTRDTRIRDQRDFFLFFFIEKQSFILRNVVTHALPTASNKCMISTKRNFYSNILHFLKPKLMSLVAI